MKLKILKEINFNTKSFFGRLMLYNTLIIFVSLLIIGIIFGYLVQNYYYGLKEWKATNNGRRIAKLVSKNINNNNLEKEKLYQKEEEIDTISRSTQMEIGIINPEGKIILKSSNIENFNLKLDQREMEEFSEGNNITKKIRGSDKKYLLMIFPLFKDKNIKDTIKISLTGEKDMKVIGGIIIQTPLDNITTTINDILRLVIYSSIIALTTAFLLSITFAHKVTKPISDIKNSALNITNEKFTQVNIPDNSTEEIKHLVKTFNYAVKQIQNNLQKKKRLEKMRKEFVANISHEFRAPLTSIKGFLELMKDDNLNHEDIKKYSEIMYKDTEYLEYLVEDLLVLGRLDSENISLDRKITSAENVINRALNSLKNKINKKNIVIETKITSNLPKLNIDINRFHQVLINLLENAITYSPVAGKLIITVQKIQIGGKNAVKFMISDQGPGIPEEELNKIWQRFYKADHSHTRKDNSGSGLGLSIVKNIINRHKGKVKVRNNKDKGATFSFILYENSLA